MQICLVDFRDLLSLSVGCISSPEVKEDLLDGRNGKKHFGFIDFLTTSLHFNIFWLGHKIQHPLFLTVTKVQTVA